MAGPVAGDTGNLRFSGYFDWPGLYALMGKWANGQQLKIYEPLYKDKISGDGFTEREINWYLEKKVDRINKYILTISLKMWDCQEVEVTQNDQTKMMQRGRIRIIIEADIQKDYQGIFKKSPFFQKIGNITARINNWDWNFNHWSYWYDKKYELQELIKKHLGIDTQ